MNPSYEVRHRHVKVVSAIILSSLLTGCVVGPDYQKPTLFAPATWSARSATVTASPAELAYWWSNLRDPLLDSYMQRAVNGNLTVAAASARVREARATLVQENGRLLPTMGSTSSATRSKTAERLAVGGNASPSAQYQAAFDTSWELDLFGGRSRSVEVAEYGLDAAQEDLRNTMLTLIGDVASNYVQVRANQARLELAMRTAKSQRNSTVLIKAKFEGGSATVADVARSEALAATTSADIPTYEIAKSAAINRLGVLLGLPPMTLSAELDRARPIPKPKFPLPVGIPAETLLARPDVRMAEKRLAQATARIGVAEAARYPALSLTGNISSQALNIGDLAQKSTIGWSIGPSLTVPLFRGGQLKAAVDVAKASRDESAANYQASVLTAMEDVENAIVSLSQQRRRVTRLATGVDAYRRANQASMVQYQSGTLNYLDFLDNQRTLYNAEGSLIDSQLAVVTAYITLNKALGGGWTGQVSLAKGQLVDANTGPHFVAGISHPTD